MEKNIIDRMRQIVTNENKNVQRDFQEDCKDLKNYNGNFLWGFSEKGTNLILRDSPFSYLQIEALTNQYVYVCIKGKFRKTTNENAKRMAVSYYSQRYCG